MQITEKTVYIVDDNQFDTKFEAERFKRFKVLIADITNNNTMMLEHALASNPRYVIKCLEVYISDLNAI